MIKLGFNLGSTIKLGFCNFSSYDFETTPELATLQGMLDRVSLFEAPDTRRCNATDTLGNLNSELFSSTAPSLRVYRIFCILALKQK
jgi:hypothetical protein